MTIPSPNYTQVPNLILDNMQDLSKGEFKVVMAICRYTLGFHRKDHELSLHFIQSATGLSESTVTRSVQSLLQRNWINKTPCVNSQKQNSFKYQIKFEGLKLSTPKTGDPLKQGIPHHEGSGSPKTGDQVPLKQGIRNKDLNKEEKKEESPYPLTEESGGSVEPAALIGNQLDETEVDTPPQSPSPQKPVLRSERYMHPTAAMEARFNRDHSGGKTYHPDYSNMEQWGVQWIWDASKGDRLNGWSDEAIKAAIAQLKQTNQPALRGDACRWLAIRVAGQRWSELDLLKPQTPKPQQKTATDSRSKGNITEEVEQGCMAELDLSLPLHQSFQEFLDLAHSANVTVSYKDISRWAIHFWVGDRMRASRQTFCQQSKRDDLRRLERDIAETRSRRASA
ncbi:replication protein [Leptothoe sp. LEGE 181152]|nr:replication protein [Leptothoe sp. LEGE 181152]